VITYSSTRDSEQLRYLKVDIASFIQRYESRPLTSSRRTLFLFPGGMGTQLLRAQTPYQDNGTPQTFKYDNFWLSPFTFLGGALFLGMRRQSNEFRDYEDKIVIPNGAVNLLGLSPYSRFTQWCELNDLDWFIFGWDWRRRLEDSVTFFFEQFLPLFQSTVKDQTGADPLQDFILVGHSFGGMLVKLMLHQQYDMLDHMTRAVTVASPYYGYDGQIHRWFEGEPLLNQIGPIDVTAKMIRVISSLPGGYVLPYLDFQTWLTNKSLLQGDPKFPLNAYPSTDLSNASQDVDPFNPGPNRYPTQADTGFDTNELQHASTIYGTIAAPTPTAHASKFFNLRGIQSPTGSTTGSITWGALTGPNNPRASPVTSGQGGYGDGTQPAWSARLVTLNSGQVVPVEGDIDHMFIMEDDITHAAIASVL
jgi:pimeloyl-ACP methyl ester carboxylesterase